MYLHYYESPINFLSDNLTCYVTQYVNLNYYNMSNICQLKNLVW